MSRKIYALLPTQRWIFAAAIEATAISKRTRVKLILNHFYKQSYFGVCTLYSNDCFKLYM